jgi:hypothetical protein
MLGFFGRCTHNLFVFEAHSAPFQKFSYIVKKYTKEKPKSAQKKKWYKIAKSTQN